MEPVELHTERLLLRPFREGDVNDVYAFARDREWQRYLMNVPEEYTRAHAEEFIARNLNRDWDTNPNFALVLDGRVAGSIGLVVSKEHQRAEIGYSLARTRWGAGLASEAARALVDWGFRAYDLAKIFGRADARNRRSWRVMEKLGMKREAIVRGERIASDGPADEVFYSLTREEWDARPN